ncbi:MAG TPA: cysteine peptidase family C39 domain-containing protein [Armatimonadota bacterium]|jgi:hypothetical protein
MAWVAVAVLLLGLALLIPLSAWLSRTDRRFWPAAGVCVAVLAGWLALAREATWGLRLLPGDDFLFFEWLPLFLSAWFLLLLAGRRLPRSHRVLVGALLVVVAGVGLLEVGGPLLLPLFASQLDDTPGLAPDLVQSTGWSCAPTALAVALRLRGIPATEREAAAWAASTPLHGTSDRGMIRAAHHFGYAAYLLRPATWEDLVAAPKPVLTDWNLGGTICHEIVVTAITATQVRVYDPMAGAQDYSPEEFRRQWLHGLLLLSPVQKAP